MNSSPYAPTILQLHQQVLEAGWSPDDLHRLSRGYELIISAFSGAYRPSGRPFVDHLVRTASVLLHHGADPVVTTLGLLHALYQEGDFGLIWPRSEARRRRIVAHAVGTDVEARVHEYAHFAWDHRTITSFDVATLRPVERDVLFARLANELEELLDHNLYFYANTQQKMERLERMKGAFSSHASAIGAPQLGAEIEQLAGEYRSIARSPDGERMYTRSYSMLPPSASTRVGVRLARWVGRCIRALGRE
jgi:(p)ppGpp synthase/HD superfamily hydrolase